MPALPKLSDVYLSNFDMGNGRVGTRGCGWRMPVERIMADNHNYQTLTIPPAVRLRPFQIQIKIQHNSPILAQ